jgi:hypothetical protein
MPKVDVFPNEIIEDVCDRARIVAAGEGEAPSGNAGPYVVIVASSRQLMFVPCIPREEISGDQVALYESMIPSEVKRNIAVIAYTELSVLGTDYRSVNSAIPFFGFLLGFGGIGHAVWIFEGHPSALEAGCRNADALIVDGGMVPFLQRDWMNIASSVMRNVAVYVHDRATYSLNREL